MFYYAVKYKNRSVNDTITALNYTINVCFTPFLIIFYKKSHTRYVLRYMYTKLSIRNYILIFLMDRYVVLTRFFDYNDGVFFATILDYYEINSIFIGQTSLNVIGWRTDMIVKVLDVDWNLVNELLNAYKYDNHLRVV